MMITHDDEDVATYYVGCSVTLPTYLPIKPCNFTIAKNNYSNEGIVAKLHFFIVTL
jgi:hypothetical protein